MSFSLGVQGFSLIPIFPFYTPAPGLRCLSKMTNTFLSGVENLANDSLSSHENCAIATQSSPLLCGETHTRHRIWAPEVLTSRPPHKRILVGTPLQYSCLENPMDGGAWWAAVHGWNAGDLGLIPGSGESPGEGNGYPLQYSCLDNFMYRGPWRATVQGQQRVKHGWVTNT